MNRSYLIISVIIFLLVLTNCSKKAKNDDEIKTMIVGTWKEKISTGTFSSKYHIMEFTNDGRYRELTYRGQENDWNSADTSKIDPELLHYIAFGDSLYYSINDSKINFYTIKSNPSNAYIPNEMEIIWIKPDKLKINGDDKDFKYEQV